MIRLNHIPQSFGIKCEIFAKCEFFNPGGSVKDRIAIAMIEDAESRGLLKSTSTIIEPTSGNAGIGLAVACAVKGYKCICVMPDKTSMEKEKILTSLGAKVIRTPDTSADDPDGVFYISRKLAASIPDSIILQQFKNPINPLAHYHITAMEIFDQCDGEIDMIVIGVGSGGTMTGVGRKIKELLPNCTIVGVDPVGSFIAEPPILNETTLKYTEVEGIGHDYYPKTLDKSVVDYWIKVTDKESLHMARKLHREEGILCGSSTGSLMSGALEAARNLKEGQKCVVMFPDGVGNYLTKFVSDYWMESKDFLPRPNIFKHWWWDITVSNLSLARTETISLNMTCGELSSMLYSQGVDVLPCVDQNRILQGIIYAKDVTCKLLNASITLGDPVRRVLSQKYRKITVNSSLGELSHILERELVAVIVEENEPSQPIIFKGFVFASNLVQYITENSIE
uniref:cystathionine beta-synthase n=4 Tax=Photinus pyralis TaxID=7054 RepID=A0A1Y1M014_PHOPY